MAVDHYKSMMLVRRRESIQRFILTEEDNWAIHLKDYHCNFDRMVNCN
jgi:hypothetical protein